MRIFVASREWVRRAPHTKFADLFAGFWGVISITSYTHWDGQRETEVPESLKDRDNVLHLCFDDATPETIKYNQFTCRLFDDNHAQQILTFIQRAIDEKAESILVHCDAGISRSGAVGTELNDYCNKYLKDDKNAWAMFYSAGCENHLRPNPHVSSLLRKHLYHQKEPMIYTTYFAQLKNLPDSIEPILITRWAPKIYQKSKGI